MKTSKRIYLDFEEFVNNEPEALKSLIAHWQEYYEDEKPGILYTTEYDYKTSKSTTIPITELSQLVDDICESNDDREESVDSNYITHTYSMTTDDDKFTFEVVGNSYRKDQSVCDEVMEDSLVVIDIDMQILEKAEKAALKVLADVEKWKLFFGEKTLSEIKSELLGYKFPTKNK